MARRMSFASSQHKALRMIWSTLVPDPYSVNVTNIIGWSLGGVSLFTLHLLVCKVIVIVGDSGLCCCVPCYTCERCYPCLCVDSSLITIHIGHFQFPSGRSGGLRGVPVGRLCHTCCPDDQQSLPSKLFGSGPGQWYRVSTGHSGSGSGSWHGLWSGCGYGCRCGYDSGCGYGCCMLVGMGMGVGLGILVGVGMDVSVGMDVRIVLVWVGVGMWVVVRDSGWGRGWGCGCMGVNVDMDVGTGGYSCQNYRTKTTIVSFRRSAHTEMYIWWFCVNPSREATAKSREAKACLLNYFSREMLDCGCSLSLWKQPRFRRIYIQVSMQKLQEKAYSN